MSTKKETAKAVKDEKKSQMNVIEPPLPALEDIIVNLGFWITMAQKASQKIVQNRIHSNGVPEPDTDKKS